MADFPIARCTWPGARRIIRSLFPPIDLFEDIADPADWPLILAAEQKTNPRLMESVGSLDLVPPARRVSGPGASFLMAPFTHVSPDRPSRFSDGTFGVLYVAREFETALFETMHHHARFMAATRQPPGWASQFRELIMALDTDLPDARALDVGSAILSPDDYTAGQDTGRTLRAGGANGIVYPSVRHPGGVCAGLFYPDLITLPVTQARHLDYHWNGVHVDYYRVAAMPDEVFRVVP